jgi:hypothetical protein
MQNYSKSCQAIVMPKCMIKSTLNTVKLDYNEQLGASRFVRYNREFIITGLVYVLNKDLGLKIFSL